MLPLPEKPAFDAGNPAPYYVAAAQIYNALRGCGAENPLCIAALANADMESAFKPAAVGDSDQAFSLWQWHWLSRGSRILAATGIDVRHETSIRKIVAALWWELNNVFPGALMQLRAAPSYEDAAAIFCKLIEGAGAPDASARRVLDAQFWGAFVATHADFLAEHPAL